MPIETTVLLWWESFLESFFSVLAFDVEKLIAIGILFIIGSIVAKWGKGVIARILKKIFSNEKLQKKTGVTPETLDKKEGWNGLLYYIPDLFRVLILVLVISVALDLLEWETGSGIIGEIFAFIPNLIAVVLLLWVGSWFHSLGKEWFENEKKLFGDSQIPKFGFYIVLWGIIISISLTQLGIGESIIPIIIGGVMGTMIVGAYGLRNIIPLFATIEALKSQKLTKGDVITLYKDKDEYEIIELGVTHLKAKAKDQIVFIENAEWMKRFNIKKPAEK